MSDEHETDGYGRSVQYLPRPCDVNSVFAFDFLAVALVAAGILGGLYLLASGFSGVFNVPPSPLALFVGNGIPMIIAAAVLSVTIAMSVVNIRFLVADQGDFRLLGVVGLALVLANGLVVGYSMYEFYAFGVAAFGTKLYAVLTVQIILAAVTLYFSSMLKTEIMQRIYEQTTSAAIAKLDILAQQETSSSADRAWLRRIRQMRSDELHRLERDYALHLEQLNKASQEAE